TRPTIIVTARKIDPAINSRRAEAGIRVITLAENRWDRVDIKTIGLLPNVLAKETAKASGAHEAWFIDSAGFVKEGGSSNAWIVAQDGSLVTRPADHGILPGVTRTRLFDVADALGLKVEERGF